VHPESRAEFSFEWVNSQVELLALTATVLKTYSGSAINEAPATLAAMVNVVPSEGMRMPCVCSRVVDDSA